MTTKTEDVFTPQDKKRIIMGLIYQMFNMDMPRATHEEQEMYDIIEKVIKA
jgi:hypothetical protein